MTPQQLNTMKLALEALEMYGKRHRATYLLGGAWDEEITLGDKVITAIEEALAQPEQEPVQQCRACFGMGFVDGKGDQCLTCNGTGEQPPQPEQEPVAWMHIQGNYQESLFRQLDDWEIKNGFKQYPLYTTPPQRTEQEPICPDCKAVVFYECVACSSNNYPQQRLKAEEHAILRQAIWDTAEVVTPPHCKEQSPLVREWVGLTDEDRLRLWLKTESEDVDRYAFAKAIEAKLKEKNT